MENIKVKSIQVTISLNQSKSNKDNLFQFLMWITTTLQLLLDYNFKIAQERIFKKVFNLIKWKIIADCCTTL